jgi:hypothetical protein
MLSLSALLLAQANDDARCWMTDQGAGLWKTEMHSINASQPYKEIHCRYESTDALQSFGGSDPSAPTQCDACVRVSGYSANCGCICPPGPDCTWDYFGTAQFDPQGKGDKSCTCNGKPGPPIPPAPAPPKPVPPKPPPPPSPPPPPAKKPPPPPPPPTPPPPCDAKLDIVVVLDGSNSIVDADWQVTTPASLVAS